MNHKDEDLVEAWNYPTLVSAEVGKHLLSSEGVESEIFGGNVDSMYMTAMGGIGLMVRRGDLESAKKILSSAVESGEDEIGDKDEIGNNSSPKMIVRMAPLILIITAIISGIGTYLKVSTLTRKKPDPGSLESLMQIEIGMRDKLPLMIGQNTRLDAVAAMDHEIVYRNTLMNYDKNVVDSALLEIMRQRLVSSLCGIPDDGSNLLKNGVRVVYEYFNKNKIHILSLEIQPSDCGD